MPRSQASRGTRMSVTVGGRCIGGQVPYCLAHSGRKLRWTYWLAVSLGGLLGVDCRAGLSTVPLELQTLATVSSLRTGRALDGPSVRWSVSPNRPVCALLHTAPGSSARFHGLCHDPHSHPSAEQFHLARTVQH